MAQSAKDGHPTHARRRRPSGVLALACTFALWQGAYIVSVEAPPEHHNATRALAFLGAMAWLASVIRLRFLSRAEEVDAIVAAARSRARSKATIAVLWTFIAAQTAILLSDALGFDFSAANAARGTIATCLLVGSVVFTLAERAQS